NLPATFAGLRIVAKVKLSETNVPDAELVTLCAENARLEDEVRAAQDRAKELTRANEASRRSIAAVASGSSLDAFLSEMLAAARAATGARNGAVVLVRGEVAERVVLLEQGTRIPRDQQEREGSFAVAILPELRVHLESTHDRGEVWAPPPDPVSHTSA